MFCDANWLYDENPRYGMLKPIAFFSPNQSNPQENAAELGGIVLATTHILKDFSVLRFGVHPTIARTRMSYGNGN
jgi:hypothetical protein